MYPVFIICRDRHTSLVALLDWLESVGNADEVYLMDNDSTWPPLLDFYESTEHTVLRAGDNLGHRVGWQTGWIRRHARGRRFIVTDPDLLPVEDCPPDAIDRMAAILDTDTSFSKAGFSLKIDDLPDHFPSKQRAIDWESTFWQNWDDRVGAWRAPIDTTFALYSGAAARRFCYKPAFRLPEPYLMRHLPWYLDPQTLSAEDAHYYGRADMKVSNVARDLACSP